MNEDNKRDGISRRDFLKMTASVGVGLALGATGMAVVENSLIKPVASLNGIDDSSGERIAMYGEHQAGIITPQQTYAYLVSFRITATDRPSLVSLLRSWTKFSDLSTAGGTMRTGDKPLLPPDDTGETLDLPASRLTATFGFGPSFFNENGKDRFGIANKMPAHLKDIPRMPGENLDPSLSGGDICIQVCAEDQQVAFHAIRNFIRLSTGSATVNWMVEGFISGGSSGQTPRNLFGFKDGTANDLHHTQTGYNDVVWAGNNEPSWMKGGTYMAYRKARMLLEVWDRSSLADQEDTFGRHKVSGAPYGKTGEYASVDAAKMPIGAHVRLAKEAGTQIHRRAYSFTDGIDPRTGNVNAGLLFISFQRNPDEQLIPLLKLMQSKDALNEYTSHVASGLFACPGGLREGQYIGQTILES